jgi:putative NAD(P)-binding protein
MSIRLFLAGATGAIGKRLTPLLLQRGAVVFGTTRSTARADDLRSRSIEPVLVDVFDAPALTGAIVKVEPNIVMHQLTDLALIHDPSRLTEALIRNARLRGGDEESRRRRFGGGCAQAHCAEHRLDLCARARTSCRRGSTGPRRNRHGCDYRPGRGGAGAGSIECSAARRHRAALWLALRSGDRHRGGGRLTAPAHRRSGSGRGAGD